MPNSAHASADHVVPARSISSVRDAVAASVTNAPARRQFNHASTVVMTPSSPPSRASHVIFGGAELICDTDAMRVLSIVHERAAGSGVFDLVAAARGDEVVEWIPAETAVPASDSFGAVLVFGGAMNVDEEREHEWLRGEKELL